MPWKRKGQGRGYSRSLCSHPKGDPLFTTWREYDANVYKRTKEVLVDTSTLTVRVPTEMKEQLDHLAEATHRSKSYLAGEAIRQYLALELWQVGEIKQALNEADAGDFAPEAKVAAVMQKYAG